MHTSRPPVSPSPHALLRPCGRGARGLLLGLLAALHLWLAVSQAVAEARILILISRNPTDTWAVAELDGMQHVLRRASPPLEAEVEYMDVPSRPPAGYADELADYLRAKFGQQRFDLILVADEPALSFIASFRDALWPHAQAVFCGVTQTEFGNRQLPPWMTGVFENTDPVGAARLILRLQPDVRRIVILDDSQGTGRANQRRIEQGLPEIKDRVQVEVARVDSVQALFRAVEPLASGSAVLLTRAQIARRMGPELLARCPVPIYGQRSPTHLGAILGGSMIDGERHGEAAARLGLRLLAGEKAAQIAPLSDVPPRVLVDFRQMERFGLPLSRLPPGAEILNRPHRVWEEYPLASGLAIAAVLCLGALVGGLAMALRQNRRNAEAVKTSLSLLNATLDASADGVLVVDCHGRVSGFNRRFVELWRIPPEIAAARDDRRLIAFVLDQLRDPASFQRRVEELYGLPEEESSDTIEFLDGRVFERRSGPQRLDGRIVGRVWTFADVTASRQEAESRRQLEARLAHTHRLEALGTLAGGIAHDFNNLLTAILGYTNLAYDSLPEGDAIRADLSAVLGASERARDLVQQILTFSRKGPSERRAVQIDVVVRDAVRLLRATVPAAVEIECEADAELPIIAADSSQIHQAVLNLGTNAAQAVRGRAGHISFRLEKVDVPATLVDQHPGLGRAQCIRLTVRDTGDGMNDETLRRAFDPFFTTKAPGDGTGLGLAVVHGIMENHSGAVTLESKVGAGTTVRLFFPINEAPAPAASPVLAAASMQLSGLRVLVVDDEQAVLGVAEQMLHRAGCRVVACAGPVPALRRLRESGPFDVLVTDLNMPQMNGTELAAEAKRLAPALAVVLATGFLGDGTVEQRAAEIGIAEIVTKPYDLEKLLGAIQRATASPVSVADS